MFRFWPTTLRIIASFAALSQLLVAASGVPDRQIAEWILHQGGRVMVNGQRQVIDDLTKLPATPFRITGVDLIGTMIDPEDLSKLVGLHSLTELSLPGPIFTPFSDSPLDANGALKYLAGSPIWSGFPLACISSPLTTSMTKE